jgi:pimeloyl-ACP methyl ester carboxylesterase
MLSLDPVERVIPLLEVGHCPHDEAPEQVNPLLLEFLKRVKVGENMLAV